MVDDPYIFGQIAAANALSDVYAMGGRPLLALNIVCYPNCLPLEILSEILRGGANKVIEAGAVIAGGHSVEDDEPKYGLAVTGIVHPEKMTTNSASRPGDVLVLTKPLGTGIINTAVKGDLAPEKAVQESIASMLELNSHAAQAMQEVGALACTDVTGFGLLGHAAEMAAASKVSFKIQAGKIPLLSSTLELAAMGMIPAGAYNNQNYLKEKIYFHPGTKPELELIFFDPQTSGGLLISIPEQKTSDLIEKLSARGIPSAAIIGEAVEKKDCLIEII